MKVQVSQIIKPEAKETERWGEEYGIHFALKDSLEPKTATILCGEGLGPSVVQKILGKWSVHLPPASRMKKSEQEFHSSFFRSLRNPHPYLALHLQGSRWGSPHTLCSWKHKAIANSPLFLTPSLPPTLAMVQERERIVSVSNTVWRLSSQTLPVLWVWEAHPGCKATLRVSALGKQVKEEPMEEILNSGQKAPNQVSPN